MELALSSFGMITSVGRSATSACAAIRAGLSMPRPIPWFFIVDEEAQAPTPLTGHPVRGYTEGFTGLGRLLRLAAGCVASLREEGGLADDRDVQFWSRTALVLVIPPLDEARFEEAEDGVGPLKEALVGQLARQLRLPVREDRAHVVDVGPAGAAAAIQIAADVLTHRGVDRVLVLAADSYLDELSLEWLRDGGRLKTGLNPVGLVPGEAGVCALIEPVSARQHASARALVEAVAMDREESHPLAHGPSRGLSLARALRSVLGRVMPTARFEGDVIADLNGETWRAVAWSHAMMRCADLFGPRIKLVLPCGSLGHVGAASGLLALALAARAFARGYASSDRTLIVCSSEYGDVSALVVKGSR